MHGTDTNKMTSANFTITEHASPCQYIRGFPHSVKSEDAKLQLAVKSYRPRRPLPPSDNDSAVTIIAFHGNGFPKELYEPLFDDLLNAENGSFRISSIWIADMAHQGASYLANSEQLEDENNWLDHARDLMLMVNHFRDEMKAPFVGLAHSMGCAQLVWLSIMHPRLFHSLLLIEPAIVDRVPPGPNAAMMSSLRRESFFSRTSVESQMRRSPFFKSWDQRALDLYLKYGLLDRPDGSVVLATPKAQESQTYVRANFHPLPKDMTTQEAREHERLLNPDLIPFEEASKAVFTRPECVHVVQSLPNLRPRTMFLYAEKSQMNSKQTRERQVSRTGTGPGGNGGVADGGVEVHVMKDVGHLCCFERPTEMASQMAIWLDKEMVRWNKEKAFWDTYDRGARNSRNELSEKWMKAVKEDASLQRPVEGDES